MTVKNPYNKDPAKHGTDVEDDGKSVPDGQPTAGTAAETDEQKKAREMERGLDRALNRIPAG